MRIVGTREYKVMLKAHWFDTGKNQVAHFLDELANAVELSSLSLAGQFKKPKARLVRFLDTSRHSIEHNSLLLRERYHIGSGRTDFTLKCRSADRYLAAGLDVSSPSELESKEKFEEDIAAVFSSRFSHSNTLRYEKSEHDETPLNLQTVADAAALFPILKTLDVENPNQFEETKLSTVNGLRPYEQVYKGLNLTIGESKVSMALILWSLGVGRRTIAAELSFRYENEGESEGCERYSLPLVQRANKLYNNIQRLDWCAINALTKTQTIYASGTQA